MPRFRYQHIQSTVSGKTPSNLLDGEIAVNRYAGDEKLFIKNTSGNVISFSSDSAIDSKINEKLDTSAFTTYSGAVDTVINNKVDKVEGKGLSTNDFTNTEKTNIDSLATNIAAISGITSTKVSNWDTSYSDHHTHSNATELASITGNVGTMAYENANSYSSATQVNTALGGKSDTGHTHVAADVTAFTGYQIAASSASVATTDTLLQVIAKLEKRIQLLETAMGGISIVKISQTDYDNLPTKDSNTLYVIV